MHKKNIVVLGGSFNPPTKAHEQILSSAINQLNAEYGILVPSSDNYVARKMRKIKSNIHYTEEQRFDMLSKICEKHPNFKISTVEYADDGKGHTYDTLIKIQEEYPDHNIIFLLGADKLHILPKWHNSEELFHKFEFAVMARQNFDWSTINTTIEQNITLSKYRNKFHKIYIDTDIDVISSTKVRQMILEENFKEMTSIVDESVCDYLEKILTQCIL